MKANGGYEDGFLKCLRKAAPKGLFGPTTMMTGTVTQSATDLRDLSFGATDVQGAKVSLSHQSVLIEGYLAGFSVLL